MSTIGLHVDAENDLTVMTLTGLVDIDQVRKVIQRPDFGTTTRVLTDCRKASFGNITWDHMNMVALEQVPLLQKQATRRTAVVVPDPETIPFARVYFELSHTRYGREAESFVTADMDEARAWLDRPDDGGSPPAHSKPDG